MTTAIRPPCDEGVVRAAAVGTPYRRATERWVLAATVLGSSMAFIDGSVVNLALPQLQADMDATIADAQWVVEAYALFLSALLLVGGSLGDRFGRRRIFVLGTVLFGAASIACGAAPDVSVLIGARCVQGVGGALLVPGSLALISATFDERSRGAAIGLWSGFSAMSAGLGPIIGGLLVDYLSWRWAFFVNIPLALAVVAIATWRVPESRAPGATGDVDWAGATLATAGLGGVVYALIEWQAPRAGTGVLAGTFAGGVAALLAFVARERRCPHPMIPLELFASRTFSGANILTLFLYAALSGVLFFLPFNLIQVQRYTTTEAGAALAPFILLMFLLSRWAGGLVDRVGGRLPLIVGPLVVAAGYAALALPGVGGSYWTTFFPGILIMGLGMTIAVAPLTTVVMGAVADRHVGVASGINNAVSRTAGLLAIAALSVLASATFNRQLDEGLSAIELAPTAEAHLNTERAKLAGATVPEGLDEATAAGVRGAIDRAFVAAFRWVAIVAALLAVLSAVVAWRMIEGKPPSRPATRSRHTRPGSR